MAFRPGTYIVLCAIWALCCPTATRAQTAGATTGAIDGRVVDRTGAVLAGVTVTAAGDALMGSRTTVSTSDGNYLFPALPPGSYALSFTLLGFETAMRPAIPVSVGATATVDVTLEVTVAELVTVRGPAAVDRRSTSIATVFGSGGRPLPAGFTVIVTWALAVSSPSLAVSFRT